MHVCVCEDVARDSDDEDEGEDEEVAVEPGRDRDVLIEKFHVRPQLCVRIKNSFASFLRLYAANKSRSF